MSDIKLVNHRKKVSDGQLEIIKLLWKYRFGSIALLKNSLGLHEGPGLYKKLKILCDGDYIDKRYDSSYKIKGLPAAYFLRTKGFRELQKLPEYTNISEYLIKYSYKDKNVSLPFISHTLQVFNIAQKFTRLYPTIKFFTGRDLINQKHFPEHLPDGFVSLKVSSNDKPQRYFLDIIAHNTPRYLVDKKITDYCRFFEEGGWDGTNSALPTILLVFENGSLEKRMQRSIPRLLYNLDTEGIKIYATTTKALLGSTNANDLIWTDTEDSDELIRLT